MALSRSASGPGGLSINTGSANLFGSSSTQPPAAGGLFGSTSSASQPAQSGGLFATTAAPSQPQATGSLFGSVAGSSQPQQTGGLFGNALGASQSGQQQTSGSQFGSAAQTQLQQPGGLFGAAMAQPQQQQQQQQQQTGGLFGSATASQPQQQSGGLFGNLAAQPQQQQGSGLFGSSTAQTQQQPGSGLFGASMSQPQQQQTGGLFGNKPAQPTSSGLFNQSKPAGGLFGQSAAQPQTSTFGQSALGPGLTMGQSTSNQQSQGQQQVVPGVRIDVSNIRSTTRFNDLQEDLQKQIADIDKAIQGFVSQKNELDAFMPGHGEQLSSIPTDVAFVSRKAAGVEAALAADATAVKQLRELVKVDADNAKLSFKAVDNLKLPTPYHQAGLWSTRGQQATGTGGSADVDEGSSDLVSFFSRTADEMAETMKKFERNLGEIETHLHGVQANVLEQLQRVASTPTNGVQGGNDDKVVELAAVLRDFEESILKVAGVVGGAREGLTQLQLGEFLGNGTNGVQ